MGARVKVIYFGYLSYYLYLGIWGGRTGPIFGLGSFGLSFLDILFHLYVLLLLLLHRKP